MMSSIFTEVLSTNEWLKVFDHIFTMPPIFFIYFIIAYLIYFKPTLLNMEDGFESFFRQMNACDINKMINIAYEIQKRNMPISPSIIDNTFTALPKEQYPPIPG